MCPHNVRLLACKNNKALHLHLAVRDVIKITNLEVKNRICLAKRTRKRMQSCGNFMAAKKITT